MSTLTDQLKAGLPDDETARQIIAEVAVLEKELAVAESALQGAAEQAWQDLATRPWLRGNPIANKDGTAVASGATINTLVDYYKAQARAEVEGGDDEYS